MLPGWTFPRERLVRHISRSTAADPPPTLERPIMYRNVQMVLVGIIAIVFVLSRLSRRFPQVAWLEVFRYDLPRLSEKQQAKNRQRANVYAGVELILLGIVLPMGYAALTVMFFNSFTPMATTLVFAGSLLCIGLGVTGIWRSRR